MSKNWHGGAKVFQLASLTTSHPPDQNSETAPGYRSLNYRNIEKINIFEGYQKGGR